MFMRTDRLLLRPIFPEDWREVYRGINDAGVVRMLSRVPWPYRAEDAQAYCAASSEPWDMRFGIALPGSDGAPLIGQIGMDCSQDTPELGYWIARGNRGRGFASEAVQGILDVASAIGMRRVAASHFLDNPASGAVLRKAGFRETGEVRPTHSLGRGGQIVLARQFTRDLAGKECDTPDDQGNDMEGEVAPAITKAGIRKPA